MGAMGAIEIQARAGAGAAVLAALAALAGCGSRTFVGGGVAHSYGSISVPGFQSGLGLGLEVGHYRRLGGGAIGAALAVDRAGYSSEGDGDPLVWAELQGRYRRDLGVPDRSGLYYAIGGAAGYTLGYNDDVVAGAFLELGYELRLAGPLALALSVRERPAVFIGGGSPIGEVHNTLMLGLDIVLLGPPPAR